MLHISDSTQALALRCPKLLGSRGTDGAFQTASPTRLLAPEALPQLDAEPVKPHESLVAEQPGLVGVATYSSTA